MQVYRYSFKFNLIILYLLKNVFIGFVEELIVSGMKALSYAILMYLCLKPKVHEDVRTKF